MSHQAAEHKKTAQRKKSAMKRRSALRKRLESRSARFDWERTAKEVGKGFIPALGTTVNFTLKAPWSHEDVLRNICKQAGIPVMCVGAQLATGHDSRGKTVYGFVGDEIDKVARNYPDIYWWFSRDGLTMDKAGPQPLKDFDQIAGRIMSEMRRMLQQRKNFSRTEHLKIAAELDASGIAKPIDVLPPSCRSQLASHNQKHPNAPIDTFVKALNAVQPECLREKILKRLSRAEEKFKERESFRVLRNL